MKVVESPTSSNASLTEPSSAKVAEDKPELKQEDGLNVDKRSRQWFLMGVGVVEQHKTALKCSGCQMLTCHSIVTIYMHSESHDVEKVERRIVGCQNCGKISTK